MALIGRRDDLPSNSVGAEGARLDQFTVYGNSHSLMYAERQEGYHSTPHSHDAEQMNLCIEGKIWIFYDDGTKIDGVDRQAVLMEPGDFSRVPASTVHWALVEEGPCKLIESHAPPYIGDERVAGPERENVVGLYDDAEEPAPEGASWNIRATEKHAVNEEALMDAYRAERED